MAAATDGRGPAGALAAPVETWKAHIDKMARDFDFMRAAQLGLESKMAAQSDRCHWG